MEVKPIIPEFKETISLTHIFIDIENLRCKIEAKENVRYYIFASSFSTIDMEPYRKFAEINIIDSPLADAADHLMSFRVGNIMHYITTNNKMVIVSRDKALGVLTHLLQSYGYQTQHIKSIQQFDELLATL
jgi:hypothetical protein